MVEPLPFGLRSDVLEEHFDELDFLWNVREDSVFNRDWTLAELDQWEQRIEAHLDGLRIAAPLSADKARERLAIEDGWMATAAASALCAQGSDATLELLNAWASLPPVAQDRARIALRHGELSAARDRVADLARNGDPALRVFAADVLSFQRLPIEASVSWSEASTPPLRALVVATLGRLGKLADPVEAGAVLRQPEAAVRRAGLEAAARSGCARTATLCREAAFAGQAPDPIATAFLGTVGDPRDLAPLRQSAEKTELAGAALEAIAGIGSIEIVPWLIERMGAADPLAPFAGAAFVGITGLVPPAVGGAWPAKDEAGEVSPEAAPPPLRDQRFAAELWRRRQGDFDPRERWQLGLPVPDGALPPRFDALPLSVRKAVYLRARLASRSAPDIELEAFAARQRRT